MTGARILSLVTPSMSPIAPRPRRRAVALTVVVVSGVALAGCGDGQPSTSTPQQATGGSSPYAPITVYAAASLHQVFDEIGARVEQETGADIQFSYAGSSDLAAQLGEGGPGDVFASANEKQMTVAVDNGSVAAGTPKRFATNTLTIVTPPSNPGRVTTLADLAKPEVTTVVCAAQVPCGSATKQLFAKATLTVKPVSEESQVIDVLGKVSSGQADAGLVYVTEATSAGDKIRTVATPEAQSILNTYPIAVTQHGTSDAGRKATAEQFVAAVLDEQGQRVLTKAGFGLASDQR